MCPNEVLQRVEKGSYEWSLPSIVASVHPVFDVSMLKKYISDLVSILQIEGLGVDESLSY